MRRRAGRVHERSDEGLPGHRRAWRGPRDGAHGGQAGEWRSHSGRLQPAQADQGWKAWDVTIEGISYVKSFREDFGSEIEQKGLESVIHRLETGDYKAIAPGKKSSSAR